jgi:hypothetical protein
MRALMLGAVSVALLDVCHVASACNVLQTIHQAAAPNVEAADIDVLDCPCWNGKTYYVYHYLKRAPSRPAYRAICPPNWAQAIDGHDFDSFADAEAAAVRQGRTPPPGAAGLHCREWCKQNSGNSPTDYLPCQKIPPETTGTADDCQKLKEQVGAH